MPDWTAATVQLYCPIKEYTIFYQPYHFDVCRTKYNDPLYCGYKEYAFSPAPSWLALGTMDPANNVQYKVIENSKTLAGTYSTTYTFTVTVKFTDWPSV